MLVCKVRFPFHSCTYFGAIWLFSCNFYAVALPEKCIVIPFIFFLVLMHDKHFCTRISGKDGKTWLQQFFSWPYTVLNCETCMEFVNGKKSFLFIFFYFCQLSGAQAGGWWILPRSWTKIKLNLLNCSCIACKTLMVGIGTKTTFLQSETLKIYLSANNQSQSTSLGSQPRSQ